MSNNKPNPTFQWIGIEACIHIKVDIDEQASYDAWHGADSISRKEWVRDRIEEYVTENIQDILRESDLGIEIEVTEKESENSFVDKIIEQVSEQYPESFKPKEQLESTKQESL